MADSTAPAAPAAPAPATAGPAAVPSTTNDPLEAAEQPAEQTTDEADSALGDDDSQFESTASIASSIFEYRNIQGRTFHSERHNTNYFTPMDEQQRNSIDISHHYLQLLLNDKLYHAPISENPEKILDIGTGTGIWAIDMADLFPNAEVIGTDLSPIQPSWIPPNLKFEIDDCTKDWTWPDNTFDFVHLRMLIGAIGDWNKVFQEAYRVCKPGGWIQSAEPEVIVVSDDGTVGPDSPWRTAERLLREGGSRINISFLPVEEDFQNKALVNAGFTDRHAITYKAPIGGWARDPKLAEVGRFIQLTMDNDLEGYTLFLWHQVMKWPADEYQVFLAHLRREVRSKRVHAYFRIRFVWGRKPLDGEEVAAPEPEAAAPAAAPTAAA